MRLVRSAGFTLIEMMIVVAIIAILSAIAYPSYIKYITRTHRVAAEGCLSQYANYMERFYTTNLAYNSAANPNPFATAGATLGFDCASAQQTGANYSYGLPSSSATAYVIQAVPINTQLARDTQCGTLQLNQAGQRKANGSTVVTGCW